MVKLNTTHKIMIVIAVAVLVIVGIVFAYSQGVKSTKTSNAKQENTASTPSIKDNNESTPSYTANPPVKKSTTGICHGEGTTYYSKTTNFTPYNSIADCLSSGGRLPKK